MNKFHSRSLRRAARSTRAQSTLTRDFGFGTISHVEHRAQVVDSSRDHLSRIRDRLRKEYDEVIAFAPTSELRALIGQLDRAA